MHSGGPSAKRTAGFSTLPAPPLPFFFPFSNPGIPENRP